jgi:putative Ca2+/H+ antiporter (TMEM165/GDT1 family)
MFEVFDSFGPTMLSAFTLISVAEIGDKSQLVCLALAMRYRLQPVILGVVFAFAVLNVLAVTVGATLALWLPESIIAVVVAAMFLLFGVQALRAQHEEDDVDLPEKPGHSIFINAFLLITLAELGDKTQLSVAAMSSVMDPFPIWLGATLALTFTSVLAALAGRMMFKRFPLALIHRISGFLFILFGLLTLAGLLFLNSQ